MKKVIVIGATGMIGKPVAKELIKAGFEVTLGVRNITKARKIFPLAKLVYVDVMEIESMQKAFSGQEIVYISLNTPRNCKPSDSLPEKEGVMHIIDAAKETGIRRIAFLSSLVMNYNGMNGFRWWLFSIKHSAVENIRKSGIPYTIFYASSLMETIDHQMLRGNKLYVLGKSKAPMWLISGEDYGRQVAWCFQKLNAENREYAIQGLEAFTWKQAAKVFGENYTKQKLKIITAPLSLLELLGNFSRSMQYGFKIMTALNNYPEVFEAGQAWEELGKPTLSLQQYAFQSSNKR